MVCAEVLFTLVLDSSKCKMSIKDRESGSFQCVATMLLLPQPTWTPLTTEMHNEDKLLKRKLSTVMGHACAQLWIKATSVQEFDFIWSGITTEAPGPFVWTVIWQVHKHFSDWFTFLEKYWKVSQLSIITKTGWISCLSQPGSHFWRFVPCFCSETLTTQVYAPIEMWGAAADKITWLCWERSTAPSAGLVWCLCFHSTTWINYAAHRTETYTHHKDIKIPLASRS